MIADTYTFCPKCAARVEIGRVPVGSPLTCRLCGLEFSPNRGNASSGAGQGGGHQRRKLVAEVGPSLDSLEAVRRWPPIDLYFSSTFSFPFRLPTLVPFLTLLLGGAVIVAGIELARWCSITDSQTLDKSVRVLLWHGLLFSLSFGGLAGLLWSWAASAWGLTILRDTSFGGDCIDSWPRLLALEGLGEWAFVACSAVLAMLPGLIATPLWHWLGLSRSFAIAITMPVLFPLFLLSTLETDSPTDPFSPAVWRSVLTRGPAWAGFYAVSFSMASVLAGLTLLSCRFVGTWAGLATLTSSAPLGWFVYCRLLGRLASFCGGRMERS